MGVHVDRKEANISNGHSLSSMTCLPLGVSTVSSKVVNPALFEEAPPYISVTLFSLQQQCSRMQIGD
jgi:hypothetical protein